MPLKLNVGLSKKIGQPDFSTLGATRHVCIATIVFPGWRQLKVPVLSDRICGRSPQISP